MESKVGATVAVAYKDISRTGNDEEFGNNGRSWTLECSVFNKQKFRHNNIRTPVSGPQSSQVGVYLDHRAGVSVFLRRQHFNKQAIVQNTRDEHKKETGTDSGLQRLSN